MHLVSFHMFSILRYSCSCQRWQRKRSRWRYNDIVQVLILYHLWTISKMDQRYLPAYWLLSVMHCPIYSSQLSVVGGCRSWHRKDQRWESIQYYQRETTFVKAHIPINNRSLLASVGWVAELLREEKWFFWSKFLPWALTNLWASISWAVHSAWIYLDQAWRRLKW